METIIQHVSTKNKEWVSSLDPKDIAQILDALSFVPHMQSKPIQPSYTSELPANVGLQGESQFENIVQQFMPIDYKLVNTAKVGKCGDFVMKYFSNKTNRKYSLLIDIKNYRNTVPTREIEKFYRDIKLNSNMYGGLLLSLNSKISGISKVIDFQEFTSDHGIVPIIFAKTKQPEVICEIIKMMFHLIEIKDLHQNEVMHGEELISNIHELSDEVQLITQCRDNLQTSKTLIEKSLNDIMFNLMQCEYNIASKIKQINKSLSKEIHIVLPVPPNSPTSSDEIVQMDIKTAISTFKDSIELKYEHLLYEIYNVGWKDSLIDLPGKTWTLYSNTGHLILKFNKKYIDAIFPSINQNMCMEIEIDKKTSNIENGKKKKDGYHIMVNPDSINFIIQLCKAF